MEARYWTRPAHRLQSDEQQRRIRTVLFAGRAAALRAIKEFSSKLEEPVIPRNGSPMIMRPVFLVSVITAGALTSELPPELWELIFRHLSTPINQYNSLAKLKVGKKINLNRGRLSQAYKAVASNGRAVALTKLHIFEMADAKTRIECMAEVELLKTLKHPNIVECLSSFIENNVLHIVFELATAGDLSRMIKHFKKQRRLIPERTIWKYFVQLCRALAHLHNRGVIHRDIKPANVQVDVAITGEGVVKLGDPLGHRNHCEVYDHRRTPYSLYYMSPERIHESGYGFKSDIWSLGCLLYEMAALQSPFYGEKLNLYALVKKIEKCSYPALPADSYSVALRELVRICVTSNPEERPTASRVQQIAEQQHHDFPLNLD